jgi:hypothetical protein
VIQVRFLKSVMMQDRKRLVLKEMYDLKHMTLYSLVKDHKYYLTTELYLKCFSKLVEIVGYLNGNQGNSKAFIKMTTKG